ncbi:hypothetical protein Fmac_027059 [Flemingia macrophylla]|uniref:beta-galactosidase n=1 Tax=Flemingia macrophylla TaxID=520843 RepID=A0ABD1LGN0_9FABA
MPLFLQKASLTDIKSETDLEDNRNEYRRRRNNENGVNDARMRSSLYRHEAQKFGTAGLGKGHAWVNRHSIGRYWPSWITASNGCNDTCDYHGKVQHKLCFGNSKGKCGSLSRALGNLLIDCHELVRHEYNFLGNLDSIKIFNLVQEAGLYAILRIGPYVCAEWNYGGFPLWLHNMLRIELRTDNLIYKNEMQIVTTKIVDMVKKQICLHRKEDLLFLLKLRMNMETSCGVMQMCGNHISNGVRKWL